MKSHKHRPYFWRRAVSVALCVVLLSANMMEVSAAEELMRDEPLIEEERQSEESVSPGADATEELLESSNVDGQEETDTLPNIEEQPETVGAEMCKHHMEHDETCGYTEGNPVCSFICPSCDQSILCIVNTKKAAQELYKKLREERKNIYHLSTNMYPKHRKRVLKLIRERLDNNEKCIVVSTSLVEAGVDLDFDIVYRQIAGLDSLIQAAGRCNRNGKKDLAKSKVYIFDFIDEKKVTNQKLQIETAASVIQDYEKVDDLTGISDYFKRLYHYRGTSLDKKNIMGEFKQMRFNFSKVAKEFKLIEENTKMIYINKELKAEELLNELKTKGASKERLREAGQYCVQIYGDERNENSLFDKLYSNGMLRPISEDMQDFYELVSQKQYSDEWGLDFSVDDVLMM